MLTQVFTLPYGWSMRSCVKGKVQTVIVDPFVRHCLNETILNIYICQQTSIIMTYRSQSLLIRSSDSVYQLWLVLRHFLWVVEQSRLRSLISEACWMATAFFMSLKLFWQFSLKVNETLMSRTEWNSAPFILVWICRQVRTGWMSICSHDTTKPYSLQSMLD